MIYQGIVFTAFLLVFAIRDIQTRLISNKLLLIAGAVTIIWLYFTGSVLSGLFGGCVGFSLFSVLYLLSREKIGAGEVKLAGLIGLMTGFPLVLLALLLALLTGSLVVGVLLALKRVKTIDSIPYAPFLCSGGIITLWAGRWLISWYWGLL